MTKTLFSPSGNPEIWPANARPEGYITPEEWAAAHPAPPSPPVPLEQAIAAKQAEINAEKDRLINDGVLFGGVLYDSDDKAQTRLTGKGLEMLIIQSMGQTPPPVEWIAMDNSRQTLTMLQLVGLGQAISGHLSACVMAANAHKAAVAAMTDANQVQAYDYSAGWPS